MHDGQILSHMLEKSYIELCGAHLHSLVQQNFFSDLADLFQNR